MANLIVKHIVNQAINYRKSMPQISYISAQFIVNHRQNYRKRVAAETA